MNILKIQGIGEVSIGTLKNIYDIYETQGDNYVYGRIHDYQHFSFMESLWKEPELNIRNLLK